MIKNGLAVIGLVTGMMLFLDAVPLEGYNATVHREPVVTTYSAAALISKPPVEETVLRGVEETLLPPQTSYIVEPKIQPIYAVPLDEALQAHIYNVCEKYSVDFDLVISVIWRESTYRAGVVSKSGSYGLMQVNKFNHDWLKEELGITDFLDAEQNVEAGIYMLAEYLQEFGDISKALMVYNMGETAARRLWAKGTYTTNYTRSILEHIVDIDYYIIRY